MSELSRRQMLQGATAVAGAAAVGTTASEAVARTLVAKRPKGFKPLAVPGKIVQVDAKGSFSQIMQPNELWPKANITKRMLEKAMMEFTGAPNLTEAMKKFIHPKDKVAIKPNGIAGQKGHTMAVNFELIKPVVEAVIAVGVPPENIMVFEQFPNFLTGTRVGVKGYDLPAGVKTATHNNRDHKMPDIKVFHGIKTRYCTQFIDATAVIDMTQIKDHSICGYTGTMKNITHGTINNPHEHHAHNASPQIAMLYNHPIVTSRVRLHITDGFKIMYDKGPLDRDPKTRIPHGAVYVATDPVAMDTFGASIVEKERKARGLKSLKRARREPRYIQTAHELGLGVHDLNKIRVKKYTV